MPFILRQNMNELSYSIVMILMNSIKKTS